MYIFERGSDFQSSFPREQLSTAVTLYNLILSFTQTKILLYVRDGSKTKGEKYQLDISKLLMLWSDHFFKPIKVFWLIVTQKNKTKTKVRKGVPE